MIYHSHRIKKSTLSCGFRRNMGSTEGSHFGRSRRHCLGRSLRRRSVRSRCALGRSLRRRSVRCRCALGRSLRRRSVRSRCALTWSLRGRSHRSALGGNRQAFGRSLGRRGGSSRSALGRNWRALAGGGQALKARSIVAVAAERTENEHDDRASHGVILMEEKGRKKSRSVGRASLRRFGRKETITP